MVIIMIIIVLFFATRLGRGRRTHEAFMTLRCRRVARKTTTGGQDGSITRKSLAGREFSGLLEVSFHLLTYTDAWQEPRSPYGATITGSPSRSQPAPSDATRSTTVGAGTAVSGRKGSTPNRR